MSKVLYLDCFSGISGDMTLGAFLDAGLPIEELTRALGSLAVDGFHVSAEKVLRAGVSATKFRVHEHVGESREHAHDHSDHSHEHVGHSHGHGDHSHDHGGHSDDHGGHSHEGVRHSHEPAGHSHDHPHRTLKEIFGIIDRSALSERGRARAKELFQRLGEAEAAIHQMPLEKVHLHEVGALDSIIDIVGAVFALEWAGVERIVCSPLNVGGGMIQSAHGLIPVPAPATVRLLGDAPIYSGPVQKELVTPTGALIATSYATSFGTLPAMAIERVGYGAGDRDHPGTPNVLRIMIGREATAAAGDRVTVVECEIDDMNPQLFGAAMDRLYAAGALEVFYVPVQMKKNRPGTLLTVIVAPARRQAIAEIVFSETTTIGLRYYDVDRECLEREIVSIETPLGAVRFKLARRGGRIINAVPEYEDCLALATEHKIAVKDVQAAALQAYGTQRQSQPSYPEGAPRR